MRRNSGAYPRISTRVSDPLVGTKHERQERAQGNSGAYPRISTRVSDPLVGTKHERQERTQELRRISQNLNKGK